jgi:hypothetical protein
MKVDREAEAVIEEIRPLLVGHGPMVQSVVLADLVAAWVAGHLAHNHGEVDAPETKRLREDILMHFIELILKLIPMHHVRIMEGQKGRFHDSADRPLHPGGIHRQPDGGAPGD